MKNVFYRVVAVDYDEKSTSLNEIDRIHIVLRNGDGFTIRSDVNYPHRKGVGFLIQ